MVAYDYELTPLCFTAEEPGSTVKLTKVEQAPDVNLQTSTDGVSWTPYTVEDVITLANVDDKVYFKAVGSNEKMATDESNYNKFEITGRIAASGNVNSLLEEDEETARTMSIEGKDYCYSYMFTGCSYLTKAPALPATTLAYYCYSHMFDNCSSLTQAPALPATTLADSCYNYMFLNCSSLTQAPALPATTLAGSCYSGMFSDCYNLTKAPTLPAKELANNCYGFMFINCLSLSMIKVGFANWYPTDATYMWLASTAASGTFECPQKLIDGTTSRDESTVPANWSMVAA